MEKIKGGKKGESREEPALENERVSCVIFFVALLARYFSSWLATFLHLPWSVSVH